VIELVAERTSLFPNAEAEVAGGGRARRVEDLRAVGVPLREAISTTVPSGMKPVPLEINVTCQKPTIPAPFACAAGALEDLAAERMSMAVAVLDARCPSDAPHWALALTAEKQATTSIANRTETA